VTKIIALRIVSDQTFFVESICNGLVHRKTDSVELAESFTDRLHAETALRFMSSQVTLEIVEVWI
jgi:hypothetical protein